MTLGAFVGFKILSEHPVFSFFYDRLRMIFQEVFHAEGADLVARNFAHDTALEGGACMRKVQCPSHVRSL